VQYACVQHLYVLTLKTLHAGKFPFLKGECMTAPWSAHTMDGSLMALANLLSFLRHGHCSWGSYFTQTVLQNRWHARPSMMHTFTPKCMSSAQDCIKNCTGPSLWRYCSHASLCSVWLAIPLITWVFISLTPRVCSAAKCTWQHLHYTDHACCTTAVCCRIRISMSAA